ncbi:hypothetical protein [Nocardia lijiangensis]
MDAPSLAQWFEHYLEDTGWWVRAEEFEIPTPAATPGLPSAP